MRSHGSGSLGTYRVRFGSSYSGCGEVCLNRRFRIFDISDYGETIRTYKRTEHDEILDEIALVGDGSPIWKNLPG